MKGAMEFGEVKVRYRYRYRYKVGKVGISIGRLRYWTNQCQAKTLPSTV